MKRQGPLFVSTMLLTTLFLLLSACTTTTASTKVQTSATPLHASAEKGTTSTGMPASGMMLPPQTTTRPSSGATPKKQPTAVPTSSSTTGSNTNGAGTNGAGTNGTYPGPPSASQAALAVLAEINQERASYGKAALTMSNALIRSAHVHNLNMVAVNQLSHQLPGEPSPWDRMSAQGVQWTGAAENIGLGSGDPTQAAVGLNQDMFNEKPPDDGHRQNILSGSNIIGIDVVVNPRTSQVWLTEDFATTS
ncbi:MAG: hypothetical protein JO031_00440 [Ktedonobacteraceae bacterium]|nr:hypothetical protein [Ktedonobacteraceae bacterium]